MKNIHITLVIITLLSLFSQQACSSSSSALKQDADALCQVYNPAKWKDFLKSHTRLEIFPELGVRIRNAIKTPEFRDIFKKYLHVREQSYYDFVKAQVSHLIGIKWQCAYFDQFYASRSIKVIRLRTDGIHVLSPENTSDNIITVAIDNHGKYYVNDKPLINNEEETLRRAIQITMGNAKDIRLLAQADSGSPFSSLLQLLYVAKSLKIDYVDFEVN